MQYLLKSRLETDPDSERIAADLTSELGLEPEVAAILVGRGISGPEEARRFLQPDAADLLEPYLFQDMKKAVSLIGNVAAEGGRILVHGDYDADGTTGSAILAQTLKSMGANVTVFIPTRSGHGYGVAPETVEQFRDHALLITVDCGISNVEAINRAKELGMRTIVTDHHNCPDELPDADCVINPKRPGETYPYADLCGAGVAFKLAQALTGKDAMRFIDLAAVGTIADMMPLTGENRAIAFLGIEKFNREPNVGLRTLFDRLKGDRALDAQGVSFSLAPCINAAGRMSTAKLAYDLMMAPNAAVAGVLSQSLIELNDARRARQAQIIDEIEERLRALPRLPRILVLYDESWEAGLVGVAAGRVAEKTGRPVILLGSKGDQYAGSGRSVPGFDLYAALQTAEPLLARFGGHTSAAGLTISEENISDLARVLEAYAERVDLRPVAPALEYDLELSLPVRPSLLESLAALEPCGLGNPRPAFLIKDAEVTRVRPLADGLHAAFTLRRGAELDAVAFRTSPSSVPPRADVVGELEMSDYLQAPQMIVSGLSFRDPAEEPYLRAVLYVVRSDRPASADLFFTEKRRLGMIYSAFRQVIEKKGPQSCSSLFAATRKLVPDVTLHQFAFALGVFGDLKLLEGIRNARIELKHQQGKQQLESSRIYRVFEEQSHGSQGKNQKH